MNIVEITDLSDPAFAVFSKLTQAQLRNRLEPALGIFIAESPKVIALALDAGCEPLSLLMEKKHIDGDGAKIIARCGEIPVYTADRDVLEGLTGYGLTRGVLCAMKRPTSLSAENIVRNAKRLAILDGVVDSTNIGAIVRSAAALGMDGILFNANCCDPLCRRAIRVSMGTIFQIPWAFTDGNYLSFLSCKGFKTVAMALCDHSLPIDDPILCKEAKLAVILGAEGNGLSSAVINQCDYIVKIPMYHGVDSLNVAAASAVAFWQLGDREK